MIRDIRHISDLPSLPNDGPIFDYLLTKIFPTDIESGPIYKVLTKVNYDNKIKNGKIVDYRFNIDNRNRLKSFTLELFKLRHIYETLYSHYDAISELSDKNFEDFDDNVQAAWNYIINTLIQVVFIYNIRINPIYTFYTELCNNIKHIKEHYTDNTLNDSEINILIHIINEQMYSYEIYIPWIYENLKKCHIFYEILEKNVPEFKPDWKMLF